MTNSKPPGGPRPLETVPPEVAERLREQIQTRATPGSNAMGGPLVTGAGELVAAATGMPVTSREMADLKRQARYDSIRAYRRAVDRLIHWSLTGKIGPRAALDIAQTVKIGAEMLMSEHVLHAGGRSDQAPPHVEGIDGGAVLPDVAPRPEPEVTVSRKVGVAPNGAPVDETYISLRSPDQTLAAARPELIGPALAELLRRRVAETGADAVAQSLGVDPATLSALLNE